MGLSRIDLHRPLEAVDFIVPGLFPCGYVSFMGAREGVGKTTVLTSLAWQMTRPSGNLLGLPVKRGPVIYLNSDAADGQARPVRHWLQQHQAVYGDGRMSDITVIEPTGAGLDRDDLTELRYLAVERGAKCLIVDSFMGSFPGVEANKLDRALQPMLALRDLAAKTGLAVIVADHLPKRGPNEKDGDRGIIGSVGKSAQARAVHVLTRVEPMEADGREVLRWWVDKSSFARSKYAMGIEVQRLTDENGRVHGVHLERCVLPEAETTQNTRTATAAQAVIRRLEEATGTPVAHAELEQIAVQAGNLRTRAAQQAVRQALGTVWTQIELVKGRGQGAPKSYRYVPEINASANVPVNHVQSDKSLVAAGVCQPSTIMETEEFEW